MLKFSSALDGRPWHDVIIQNFLYLSTDGSKVQNGGGAGTDWPVGSSGDSRGPVALRGPAS